jgi:mercuric reductase
MSGSREYRILIKGMTCDHCVATVKNALGMVTGIEEAEVDLESGLAVIRGKEGLDGQQVVAAVERAGYWVQAEVDQKSGGSTQYVPKGNDVFSGAASNSTDADLIVIGGGSAGFAAAIQGHELGARVIMVNDGVIGGTCVNVGCIPSKTLIRAAQAHHLAKHQPFAGIESSSIVSDFAAVIRQKDELVSSLRQAKYIDVLAAYDNIRLVEGRARFISPGVIRVDGRKLRAPRIIVATGSRPWIPPIAGLEKADPLTSTSVFELKRLPKSIIVLGGRYIALECAQMLSRFGVEVTVLQRSGHILPTEDDDLTEMLAGFLREEGIRIETGVKVESITNGNGHVAVKAEVAGGGGRLFTAERILCATGRRPNTEGLGLEEIGVQLGKDGRVIVDEFLQTAVKGIFAAGDVIGEPAFVYTAAYEGNLAAVNALGSKMIARDYRALPWVIFTDPQVAGVGLNENDARQAGIEVDVSRLDLEHVPRALTARDTRGFIKMIKQRGSDQLVGARILAPEGGEQIMEAAMAIRYGIGVSEIASMFHPYLTQAEGLKLCAQSFAKDVSKLSCCSG